MRSTQYVFIEAIRFVYYNFLRRKILCASIKKKKQVPDARGESNLPTIKRFFAQSDYLREKNDVFQFRTPDKA